MQETWVRSLGWEDLLEKGKATHSSIVSWKIPWTVWSMGLQRVGHNWATFSRIASFFVYTLFLSVLCLLGRMSQISCEWFPSPSRRHRASLGPAAFCSSVVGLQTHFFLLGFVDRLSHVAFVCNVRCLAFLVSVTLRSCWVFSRIGF